MNFEDWAPLKLVDHDLLSRVRLAYVFGKTGQEALIFTDEDKVLACGKNTFGCLGLGNDEHQLRPVNIPELDKKKIKGFAATEFKDGSFVCAYTFSGQIYFWGKNFQALEISTKPTTFPEFSKKVSEVACGELHCLILSTEGEVYYLGKNNHEIYESLGDGLYKNSANGFTYAKLQNGLYTQIVNTRIVNECELNCYELNGYSYTDSLGDGQYTSNGYYYVSLPNGNYVEIVSANNGQSDNGSYNTTPTLVEGDLKGKNVVKISCGSYFSVCVLDNGEVYAWGNNSCGQLGWSSQSHSSFTSPKRVPELTDVIVKKIICGSSHVLAINDVSELFSWGSNKAGQLGSGNTTSCHKPTKIGTIGKVINIAAVNDTSAAMTENSEIYMWGNCGGSNLMEPTLTHFQTMYEVLAYFADPRIMHKPMSRHFQLESVGDSIKCSFGDAETSDLTIIVEDKKILVHKLILKLRSNYFKLLLQEPWVKEDDKIIKISQNYDGIHAYLQYIYTGTMKATPEVALELLKIADEYHDLVLKNICEKAVRHGISVDNVANLYSLALKLGAKKLAKYCMSFAGNHMGEVLKTPGFSEWDKETYREFMMEGHKHRIFRS